VSATSGAAPPTRGRTVLRVGACAALGVVGMLTAMGCLLAWFLANLSFFGERPEVPAIHTFLLLSGAAAGIVVPALVALVVLDTWPQRLVVAALMLAAVLLGALTTVAVLGS
jgi:hypothetical protein